MVRYPAYVPMIPQGYLAAMVGASPGTLNGTAGPSGLGSQPPSGGCTASSQSSDVQVQLNQQAQAYAQIAAVASQMMNTHRQYSQLPMYGFTPMAGLVTPRPAQDLQNAGTSSEPDVQTGLTPRLNTSPSLLQLQQSQLEQYIGVNF